MRLGGLSIVSRSQTLPAQMANGGSHGTAAGALTPPATTEIALRSASVLSLALREAGEIADERHRDSYKPAEDGRPVAHVSPAFQRKTECSIPVTSCLNKA